MPKEIIRDLDSYLKEVNSAPFAKFMGFRIIEMSEGLVRGEMVTSESMVNQFGGVHGGAIMAFADYLFGVVANMFDRLSVAIDFTISFFSPADPGVKLFGEGRVLRKGKRLVNVELTVINEEKRIIAKALATAMFV
ncbi:MAG: PaaI family thioesterase [Candidatus Jordarchaeum sp.]|uniref:PaaI family thioesterase n=1 Tax=Candidatus Jordarchaeum sp. TaxID=2823881 RepID=UPI0040495516